MPTLFPTASALAATFASSTPSALLQQQQQEARRTLPTTTPRQAPEHVWTAWSAADDVKKQAKAAGDKAVQEYEKASAKAQEKVGHIELFSAKYYAACTFGGLLACVSALLFSCVVVFGGDCFGMQVWSWICY